MKFYDLRSFVDLAPSLRKPYHDGYYAMFSSILGGIVTDPALMTVPVDDHLVHRGDGVFETFKCVNSKLYNMKAHMERLESSAIAMNIKLPYPISEIIRITIETVKASGHNNCLIRILVSRGPGSMGVNPYDCSEQQLYIVVAKLPTPFMDSHPEGATMKTSSFAAKSPFLSNVKSCNYLVNALMKKEAVDSGVDFAAAFDADGFLAEGATENIGIVTPENALLFPRTDNILKGTTMVRVAELSQVLIDKNILSRTEFCNISREMMMEAAEILIVGTTGNVISVRQFDGKAVLDKNHGPIYHKLNALLLDDMSNNNAILTPLF